MTADDWKKFWDSYRRQEVASERDLFIEVGRTVNGAPMSPENFQIAVARAVDLLGLAPQDRLLELCCGNGLMTQYLARRAGFVRAVDFSEHLIAHAQRFHPADNVTYVCAGALSDLRKLSATGQFIPNKVLLGDALGYFDVAELRALLEELIRLTAGEFLFVATAVPSDELKWNFYNTEERRARFRQNQTQPNNTNDGIGRWWSKEDLAEIGRELNLQVTCHEQPSALSNFRMDALMRPAV